MKFVHITSPVKVSENRDLFFAQPITFETFRIAKEVASSSLYIKQCTVQFEEDREVVPEYISLLENLKTSIQDLGNFESKFPFIHEILNIAYQYSEGFDYMIYGNVDISLMPYFYNSIFEFIREGHDAIVINRRSITDKYRTKKDLPLMWAEVGETHPGWDCFVFKRNLYPKFNLGKGVIGAVSIGRILLYNLMFHSENFLELKHAHLTFHLGFSATSNRQYTDKNWIKANIHNDEQLEKILNEMILAANDKDLSWAHRELGDLCKRRKKYNEGLYGAKRFFGYWKLKKIISIFIRKKDIDDNIS
jgi:hypothetical protein